MMAADEQQSHRNRGRRQRLLFVVEEMRMDRGGSSTYLLFNINIKVMFAAAPNQTQEQEDDGEWLLLRPFPRPVAQFDTLRQEMERLDFAVVGSYVVGVSNVRRTVLYDYGGGVGGEVSPGPELRFGIPGGTALIPLGGQVYAIGYRPCWTSPSFQALLPPAVSVSGGRRRRWSWRALPTPHHELWSVGSGSLRGWLGAGARVWVSAQDKGTYSFDTLRHGVAWRKEGEWLLPVKGRGLFVPDLLRLCFGLCPRLHCLCAFDPPATATVVRHVWPASFPQEYYDLGFSFRTPGSLAYLGDGKFCISWTMEIERNEERIATRFALLLVAVQLIVSNPQSDSEPELSMVKRKVRCYNMPSNAQDAYLLQPALV